MANIKDLKKRIKSTKGTYKITSAMKLVSAAKLARAQQRILSLKPYSNELMSTLKTVAAVTSDYEHDFFKDDSENKHAHLLIISSDKGLCGGYNGQLYKEAKKFLAANNDKEFKVHFIGKKVKELIAEEVNVGNHYQFEKVDPTHDEILDIADELSTSFETGEVGSVHILYNSFESAMSCFATASQILPFSMPEDDKEKIKEDFPFDFKYAPSAEDILDTMIPEVYANSIYTAVLDAIASEHGMRMVAMDNASSNCNDVIKKLTLKMNKLRQAAITTELIEVVSGAESLNG